MTYSAIENFEIGRATLPSIYRSVLKSAQFCFPLSTRVFQILFIDFLIKDIRH